MQPRPTPVYDTYWRFAAERHAVYLRRLHDPRGPWTDDPVLRRFRFTNVFRAADRVSQYLIREILYREDRSQEPEEIFFRTLLFKLFNKIETWEYLERLLGPLSWRRVDFDAVQKALDHALQTRQRIYSPAYIMPAPRFGHLRKHANHLALLRQMMIDKLPAKIEHARSLEEIYTNLLQYHGLGPFLAFQYTIDLNYSRMTDFDEAEFVVAGPGAIDGISKCFDNAAELDPQSVIHAVTERQETEFRRLGLSFSGLFGRSLRPIDCQNIFCEISKYSRVAHPEVIGISGRRRIKQTYLPATREFSAPKFPPKWGIFVDKINCEVADTRAQLELFN